MKIRQNKLIRIMEIIALLGRVWILWKPITYENFSVLLMFINPIKVYSCDEEVFKTTRT